jgi:hypothetical protein
MERHLRRCCKWWRTSTNALNAPSSALNIYWRQHPISPPLRRIACQPTASRSSFSGFVSSGYGSFRRTVPGIVVVCKGWVNPMELTRLNGPLAELIPPRADPARFDAPQDEGFRHPDCLRSLSASPLVWTSDWAATEDDRTYKSPGRGDTQTEALPIRPRIRRCEAVQVKHGSPLRDPSEAWRSGDGGPFRTSKKVSKFSKNALEYSGSFYWS